MLVVSAYPERQYGLNVLRSGANGYLAKDASPEKLLRAVRQLLSGRSYASTALAERLIAEGIDGGEIAAVHARLSAREFQVFHKLACGDAVSRIAGDLQLSVKTVSTYRTRILEKLGLLTNVDLTAYAWRNNLIQR